MTIVPRVWNFPTFPVDKQLFHVPGAAIDGGFTAGGVNVMSPEPGGRAMLEMQPAWSLSEWDYPLSSWVMSKANGEVFRIRLAPTPQVLTKQNISPDVPWNLDVLWSNSQPWRGDIVASYAAIALQGSNVVQIDMAAIGPYLQAGHLIGHSDNCYLIDEIIYSGSMATITVKPPLRKNVAIGDSVYFRPFFLGVISNGNEMKQSYDSDNAGMIQLNRIIFTEVMV